MRLHHMGIAVLNIEKAKQEIQLLYPDAKCSDVVYDEAQDAYLCLIDLSKEIRLELVSGEKVKRIALSGFRFYHICLETENFDQIMTEWSASGLDLISPPKEAVLFDSRRVAFWRTQMGLVELLETENEHSGEL